MDSWLQQIFSWLPSGGSYYALVGAISFFESLAVAGIFVPGSVLIVFAGFLAAQGKGDYATLVYVSAAGALAGDLISYWLGARFGGAMRRWRLMEKRREMLQKAELFFLDHGGKSVFIGRFVGFLRPFIPFVAGGALMRPLPFFLFAALSGVLWGIAYPGLGYFFGSSWALVRVWTGRFGLFVAVLLLLLVLDLLFWKRAAPWIYRLWLRLWNRLVRAWDRILVSPGMASFRVRFPAAYGFLADRFTLRRGSGLYLTIGFLFSALFSVLFFWLVRAIHLQKPLTGLDRQIYLLMTEIHHPLIDRLMVIFTCLGDGPVLTMATALFILWLILQNRDFSAVIVLAGMGGGPLLVFLQKGIFQRLRPEPFFDFLRPAGASFPSAHAFLSLILLGLLVYVLMDTNRAGRSRFHLILAASFLVLLISFTRIYLGVHWLSDVLGGLALAALWLTFLITASEMRRRYGGEFPWRPGVELVRLSPLVRATTFALAALAALGGTAAYIVRQLSLM